VKQAGLKARLLGEIALFDGARELPLPASRKTRAMFAYLLRSSRPVRRERLCELFFELPDDPRAALRWSLSKIRTTLGPHAHLLVTKGEQVGLAAGVATDLDELERAAEGSSPITEVERLMSLALEPPLAGLEIDGLADWNSWLAAERSEFDRVRARVLLKAAREPGLTDERRRMLLREVEAIGGSHVTDVPERPPLLQTIRYCFAGDGLGLAYACTGQGPPLVKAANWLNHLELDWTGPVWGRMFRELSDRYLLVRYDERGNGLSDRDVADISFDAFVRDLETVVDTLGLDRFPLLGISQGGAVSIAYAARHPERVSHLVLLGAYSAGWRHRAPPEEAEKREAVITLVRTGWAEDNPVYRQIFSQTFMPSATMEELAWFNEFQRQTASAANAARFLEVFANIDVRDQLAAVQAPTLVLHARDDRRVPVTEGQYLAAHIPSAQLVVLESDSHIPLSREPATQQIIAAISDFVR
jgi:pimeloyl-ACP methyl ester carboxylesterase